MVRRSSWELERASSAPGSRPGKRDLPITGRIGRTGRTGKWRFVERQSEGAVVVVIGGTTQPAGSERPCFLDRMDVLRRAWADVCANRGASGVDGATVDSVAGLGGGCVPPGAVGETADAYVSSVGLRRVRIPKPGRSGGLRPLSIPTVADRVVMTAAKPVLENRSSRPSSPRRVTVSGPSGRRSMRAKPCALPPANGGSGYSRPLSGTVSEGSTRPR